MLRIAAYDSPTPYPDVSVPGHDPSALQKTRDGHFVMLVTASGGGEALGLRFLDPADYGAGFKQGAQSYDTPGWLNRYGYPCAQNGGVCPFWAPDLPSNTQVSDDLTLYFSVPELVHSNVYCIGRAIGTFARATIEWQHDREPVLCTNMSATPGAPRAIDPSVVAARDGRLWLSFGSFSPGGIAVVELNATTGALTDAALSQCGAAFPYCVGSAVNVANRWCRTHDGPANGSRTWCPPSSRIGEDALEASYLYERAAGDFYLFVDYFSCCRGMDATYELRVGRAAAPTGPFVGRDGAPMADGGGALVLGSVTSTAAHRLVGPGHAGILAASVADGGDDVLTFDFQGVDGAEYRPQARALRWDDDGWPVVSDRNFVPQPPRAGVGVQRAHRRLGV